VRSRLARRQTLASFDYQWRHLPEGDAMLSDPWFVDHADAILAEHDPHAFAFDDDGASWRGHRVSTEDIITMRRDFATSFGSCSFEEPIGDLKELGWL